MKEVPIEYLPDIPISQSTPETAASSQPTGTTTSRSGSINVTNTITERIIERIIEQPITQIIEVRDYPKTVELDDLKVGNQDKIIRATTEGLWAGDIDPDSAPFYLTMGGAITASNITATGGTIAGWTINTTSIADSSTAASANVLIDSANDLIRLGPTTGNYITIDGANQRIRSSNYVSGTMGAGFNIEPSFIEIGDIRARGKFSSAVFEKESIASVGGSLLVTKSTDVLNVTMTAADNSTLTISGAVNLAVGDFLRIKDLNDDEWFEVTDVSSAPTYTVTRDKGSAYSANANPAWTKGATVVNYGQSGDGAIFMTASEANSPRFSVITHAGAPWTTQTERLRIGNLNSYFTDITSDVYGFAVGDNSDYLRTYHDGSALRFKLALASANSIAEISVGTGGYIKSGQTAYATGTGWWFGNTSGENKASIGDATQYLKYSGGLIEYAGAITALYPLTLKSYATADLPEPLSNTGEHSFTATS
jgi:hypothetical protein